MKKTLILLAVIAVFCTAILWITAQNGEKPVVVGVPVTVAVDGVKDKAAFDALSADLLKVSGITDITTNFKTGILTARIDEAKVTLGDLVNTIAKHPRADDAEKFYVAKIVCYLNSRDEEKTEKFSDTTKASIIANIKKRSGVSDITLSDDGRTAKILIIITDPKKMRTGVIGSWFGHGFARSGMMVSTAGPVISIIPRDNKECNQCHAHRQ